MGSKHRTRSCIYSCPSVILAELPRLLSNPFLDKRDNNAKERGVRALHKRGINCANCHFGTKKFFMKSKIIITVVLPAVALGATAFFLWQKGEINIPPIIDDKNQKLPCPNISFSFDKRALFEKFFSFFTPIFATPPSSPLQNKLCLLEKPILNNLVTLLYKFKSMSPAPNAVAKIELPESFVLVNGSREWQGSLAQNEEKSFEIVIKSTKVGYYQLKASVSQKDEGYQFDDSDVIDIEITSNNAILDSKPENNWYRPAQSQAVPMPKNNEALSSQLLLSNAPELNKEFTVIYRVTPQIDIPDPQRTQMDLVFLPKGFKVLNVEFPQSGRTYRYDTQLSWKGSIAKNQTAEIKATFLITDTGQGSIYGSLNVQEGGGIANFMQDAKVAELYVDKYGGTFTFK